MLAQEVETKRRSSAVVKAGSSFSVLTLVSQRDA
jgi:hypothetical protein